MLGKLASIGQAFITGLHGLAVVFGFIAAAAFVSWCLGGMLEVVTRRFLGWHYSESTWTVLCLTTFLVAYGLGLVAPALAETIWLALKGAFFGALASGAVAYFTRLPWRTVALWGGIGFFVLCIFASLLRARPAPVQSPDIYGIGVDEASTPRLNKGGLLR